MGTKQDAVVDWHCLLDDPEVSTLIDLALQEDIGPGDVTTNSIFPLEAQAEGRIIARRATVVCGLPMVAHLLRRLDPRARVEVHQTEGAPVDAGVKLATLRAQVRAMLAIERCMLNFLMRLCGIAANARAASRAVPPDAKAEIFDTRKTLPGWRKLDKAAARTGGAHNHRFGLFDAVLIKDNHVAAAGSLRQAILNARESAHGLSVEVEIDYLEQLEEAIEAGADIVLLDNFVPEQLREAVRQSAGRVLLEASGGITLADVATVAATGVDRISMGALTHTVVPADLSLELDTPERVSMNG